jgi:hypothetical protein
MYRQRADSSIRGREFLESETRYRPADLREETPASSTVKARRRTRNGPLTTRRVWQLYWRRRDAYGNSIGDDATRTAIALEKTATQTAIVLETTATRTAIVLETTATQQYSALCSYRHANGVFQGITRQPTEQTLSCSFVTKVIVVSACYLNKMRSFGSETSRQKVSLYLFTRLGSSWLPTPVSTCRYHTVFASALVSGLDLC